MTRDKKARWIALTWFLGVGCWRVTTTALSLAFDIGAIEHLLFASLLILFGCVLVTTLIATAPRSPVVNGACGRCGYDLRGTTGPTCPECGASIAVPAEAPADASDKMSLPEPREAARRNDQHIHTRIRRNGRRATK